MCEEMYYWMHQNENTLWIPDSGAFFTSFSPNHSPVNWENTSQINQWWKQSLAAALNPVPLYLPSFSRPFKCQARRDWWDAEGGTRTDKFHRLPHHVRRETKGWGVFFCLMWLKNSHDCEISWKKKRCYRCFNPSWTQSCYCSSSGADPEETILNAFKVFDPEGTGALKKDL